MKSDSEQDSLLGETNQDMDESNSKMKHEIARCSIDCMKCVNIRMIPSKLCFFLNDSLHVVYASYLIVFLTSVGLSVKEASVISGCCLVAAAFLGPVWGYVADRVGRSDIIFVILVTGTCVSITPSPWVAASIKEAEHNITLIGQKTVAHKPFQTHLFWSMLTLQCVGASFLNPIHAFTVSFVMSIIKSSDKEVEFGKQNLFGSIGIVIISGIGGIVIKHYHSLTLSQYTPAYILIMSICIMLIPIGLILSLQSKSKRNQVQVETPRNRLKILQSICNTQNAVFIFTVILAGVSSITMTSFLFQLMNDQMDSSKLAMGLANTVAAVGEIIVFFLSSRIMKVLNGPINCMMLSILSYFIRFLVLSFTKNAWLVLPIQTLHGFSFAIFWVGATEYTYQIAHEAVYTTVFSAVMSFYLNIGGLLGNFVGGIIYNDFGGAALFFGMSWMSGIWLIFMLFYFHANFPKCEIREPSS